MRVLTSRAYIGEREVNKLNRVKDPSLLKEEDRYYYTDAQWDAIIPQKLFFDVQELLIENKKKARKYVHDYRLTGLIECGVCGQKLCGKSGTGKNAKYFYYGHSRKMLAKGDNHLKRCEVEI